MSSHDHAHHGVTATGRNKGRLVATLLIAVAVFIAQIIGAMISGSLALLGDAGHVLIDAGGVALALGAALLAARRPIGHRTFGWARAEVFAAAINGLVLIGVAGYVAFEAVRRLIDPSPVDPAPMALFGAIGLVGNMIAVLLLFKARDDSLNMRGAFLEVATDAATSVGVLVAATVMALTGFVRADAVMSLLIAALIAPRALRLLRDASHVLLEAAPPETDLDAIREHIRGVEHVRDIHDLHVHTVTSGQHVLSAHVVVEDRCFQSGHVPLLLDTLQDCAKRHFDVEHATFQLEPACHSDHEHATHA